MSRCSPRVATLALLAAAMLGGSACNKDAGTDPKPGEVPELYGAATAPDSLLENLQTAYAERDAAEYNTLLAEDYVFEFSDIDVQDPDVPADDFDLDLEALVHERMLGPDYVQALTLSFEFDPTGLSYDEHLSTPSDSLWTVLVTNCDLFLFGGTPFHPDEPSAFEVEDGVLQFWFRKTQEIDPASGEKLWAIARCKEHNFGGGGGKPADDSSWGSIKALFR